MNYYKCTGCGLVLVYPVNNHECSFCGGKLRLWDMDKLEYIKGDADEEEE